MRIGEDYRCSVEEDPAGIGPMHAGEDLYQGALACAIFPEQRVNLAGKKLKSNSANDRRPPVALGDIDKLNYGFDQISILGMQAAPYDSTDRVH
jgi:hypothetical protein